MLSELSIDDFAIIDHLLVRFEPGFTVLTGETGAGKSIIIDALQTALGVRTGPAAVRTGAELASVEAIFDLPEAHADSELATLLDELGVANDSQLILRREINRSGRSTARINGRAVPLTTLASVGNDLVDIHGQSEHLSVLRHDRQLESLDVFGGLRDCRTQVAVALRAFAQARNELEALTAGQREAERTLDLLRFQVEEIESARLSADEEDVLRADRIRLANAEKLQLLSRTAHDALSDRALEAIDEAQRAGGELGAIDQSVESLVERLVSARYELEDVAQELRGYTDSVEYDPRRLAEVDERLDLLARLMRKYGSSVGEVIEFGVHAREQLDQIEHFEDRLAEAAERVERAEAEAGRLAEELSTARVAAAAQLTESMRVALQGLGLKSTGFQVEVTQHESASGIVLPGVGRRYSYTSSGVDSASFLVSFNPGEPLRPLDKVASGGEASRFLLALKSVLADADRTPTLIFDEVDVGVGGRHGTVVGERLRDLSAVHQVLSITHLPQVAALAAHHLTVAKAARDGRTTVEVRALAGTERVEEIAEMMSGTGTETARRNAAELLAAARRRS